ncbi:helix-turn-helix domain-containing protein [Phenylobacterium sp. VNQ135]|uniref:helix-turn-helix domain-containing protein n=1 Tax=Phenylobacterium sp. VNQ135 TaxID=3400922 RepID=UPI003C02AD50
MTGRRTSRVGQMQIHLRAWRELRLLTQQELAQAASTSPAMISRLEHGTARPSPDLLARLATALELPASELLHQDPGVGGHGLPER